MAFRFKRKESIAAGFARLVAEQIAQAVRALEESADGGVHDARICIKRVRGLLRLFHRALPEGSSDRESDALSQAAHGLATLRDAQMRITVFDSVVRGVKMPGIAAARRKLLADFKAAAAARPGGSPVRRGITTLRAIGARLPGLKPDSGWTVISHGLRIAYRRARRAHAAARAENSTAAMHTWRRRSKDFEYQLQLLRKIDPPALKRTLRAAARLNDLLGEDHDLAVLDRTLADARQVPAGLRDRLSMRIARRRKKLQRRAFAAGSELFFEKPAVVVKELARCWKRWRQGK